MGEQITNHDPQPAAICGYGVQRLLGQASYLVRAEGREAVLKVLDDDCMLRGQLHPMIRDRLGRVREVAHIGVANLLGAQRHEGGMYLVWQFVEGVPLDEFAAQHKDDPALLRRVAPIWRSGWNRCMRWGSSTARSMGGT